VSLQLFSISDTIALQILLISDELESAGLSDIHDVLLSACRPFRAGFDVRSPCRSLLPTRHANLNYY
jgi:hypothetical protein